SLMRLDVVLDRPVQPLDAVKSYGQGSASIAEFMRRVHSGFGHVLTPQDIQKRNALETTDLFRTIPGVRVMPSRGFGNVIALRGGCRPRVYLNGTPPRHEPASNDRDVARP